MGDDRRIRPLMWAEQARQWWRLYRDVPFSNVRDVLRGYDIVSDPGNPDSFITPEMEYLFGPARRLPARPLKLVFAQQTMAAAPPRDPLAEDFLRRAAQKAGWDINGRPPPRRSPQDPRREWDFERAPFDPHNPALFGLDPALIKFFKKNEMMPVR